MAIRNQNWYDLAESRPWPISDEATAVDDNGVRLPSRAIADLHIAYPEDAAQRVFISAVAITPTLATVTLLGCDNVNSPASFVPLAAISLVKPFDAYRMQTLEALYPGVGGWIVFGQEAARDDANVESFHARFSTPAQSIVHPSCTRVYRSLPVSSIGKLGSATALTGLIRLSGGNDLEVVKECREIPLVSGTGCDPNISQALDVIVVRLKDTVLNQGTGIAPVPTPTNTSRNVYDIYKGPCQGRPESVSCGEPRPIELLASVPPDCCGNIDLVLRGCAVPSRVTEEALVVDDIIQQVTETCGVVVDCGLSLAEACITPDRLPDADGRLPNEYDDLCESFSSVSITLPPDPIPGPEESFSVIDQDEQDAADPDLPYTNNFANADPDMVVEIGAFNYIGQRQTWSTEGRSGEAFRNVGIWNYDWDTHYKRVAARVQLVQGGSGTLHNAAVVANYKETSPGSNRFSYYVAEIDWDGYYQGYKLFRIGRFNGTSWTTEFAVPVAGLQLYGRYDIYLSIYPSITDPNAAWLYAQLIGVDDGVNVSIGPLAENNYSTTVGKFGVGSNRSATRFHQFALENTADVTNGPPFVEP